MLRRERLFQGPRNEQKIAGCIVQQLARNVAGERLVVRLAVKGSGDEKLICESLRRRDDGAGDRFP
jgi:hypothetical protein